MESLLPMLSYPSAVLPVLGFLWLLWWLDRYEREPLWLLGGVFLWGALGATTLAAQAGSILPGLLPFPVTDLGETVLLTPLVEEPSKALVLILVARSIHFDNVTDGFVYGAAAGLGFGMTENLLYFQALAEEGDSLRWLELVFTRSLFPVLMHAMSTSAIGAALGFGKFRKPPGRALALAAGMVTSVVLHASWNGLVVAEGRTAQLLGFGLLPLEFVFLFVLFQLGMLREQRIIQAELQHEADEGFLPPEDVEGLSSWARRVQADWAPQGVDVDRYARLATTLAFRKHQARIAGKLAPRYLAEVEELREKIAAIRGRSG